MKNTIENAKAFLTKYRDERTHPVSVDYFAEMMTAYANSVRPDVVVPSEEWIVSKIKKGAFYSFEPTYNQGLKIGWNEHKEQLKSLNPTLTFTELNHTEK